MQRRFFEENIPVVGGVGGIKRDASGTEVQAENVPLLECTLYMARASWNRSQQGEPNPETEEPAQMPCRSVPNHRKHLVPSIASLKNNFREIS